MSALPRLSCDPEPGNKPAGLGLPLGLGLGLLHPAALGSGRVCRWGEADPGVWILPRLRGRLLPPGTLHGDSAVGPEEMWCSEHQGSAPMVPARFRCWVLVPGDREQAPG